MKKFLSLLMAFVMTAMLAACGAKEAPQMKRQRKRVQTMKLQKHLPLDILH